MNLKVFHGEGSGNLFNLICALKYAIVNQADIINLSLGFYAKENPKVLDTILDITLANNILVVSSSGNDGSDNNNIVNGEHYPSSYNKENMIAVAALNETNTDVWEDANFGRAKVNIATSGEHIYSTYINGQYAWLSGTSMAAGKISEIAANHLAKTNNYEQTRKCIIDPSSNSALQILPSNKTIGTVQGSRVQIIDYSALSNCQ